MSTPISHDTGSPKEHRLLHQQFSQPTETPEVSKARAMEQGKTYILDTGKELRQQFTDQAGKIRRRLEGTDQQSKQYSREVAEFVRARLTWITQQYTERILLNQEGYKMLFGEIERTIGEAEQYAKEAEKVRSTVQAAPTEIIGRPRETPPVADNTHPELPARETADDVWSHLKEMRNSSTELGRAHQGARVQKEQPAIASTREQYIQALTKEREYILQKRDLLPSLVSGNATNRLYTVNREIERLGTLDEKRAVYIPELRKDFASIDQHLKNVADTSLSPEQHKQALREADRARSYLLSSVKLTRELGLEDQFQTELSKYGRLKELVPPGSMIV